MITDKDKLISQIEMLYISPRHFNSIEATETEIEIRSKLESFKKWAQNLINDKIK